VKMMNIINTIFYLYSFFLSTMLFLPLILCFIFWKFRNRIEYYKLYHYFGYLTIKFKSNKFYLELIKLLVKISLIIASIALKNFEFSRGLYVILVIAIY
jgi:hypothetical protein